MPHRHHTHSPSTHSPRTHSPSTHRPSTHRHHPAYDPRPAHPGAPSSTLATQLIIAALSFSVIVGAAFQALGSSLGN